MEKQILLPRKVVPQLQSQFDVSRMTINLAMRFKLNSELAQRIRETAIKDFGLSIYYPPKNIKR